VLPEGDLERRREQCHELSRLLARFVVRQRRTTADVL